MLAYIWNEHSRFPSEVLRLPPGEREFIFHSSELKIEANRKAMEEAKR